VPARTGVGQRASRQRRTTPTRGGSHGKDLAARITLILTLVTRWSLLVFKEVTMKFERFWSAYPRKVAKGAAIKAWEKLNPNDELTEAIVLAVDAQKRNRRKTEEANDKVPEKQRRFIADWKHPATWLNQQCWLDEISSIYEIRQINAANSCDGCSQSARWVYPFKGKNYCIKCYDERSNPNFKAEVYKRLCDAGLGKLKTETREQWLERIKHIGSKALKRTA
jgi:hypothetical protein